MERSETRLVLASASPRRRELLERFSIPFEILPARGEEAPPEGPAPEELVKFLAAAKAEEVWRRLGDDGAVIVGADTVVVLNGAVLGKPGTPERAEEMLRALSGKTHQVWTGVCVRRGGRSETGAACTTVRFRDLEDDEIRAYVDSGEPLDKAGAYGYQGLACLFVDEIRGDFYNVMGLPMNLLGQMLRRFGVRLL